MKTSGIAMWYGGGGGFMSEWKVIPGFPKYEAHPDSRIRHRRTLREVQGGVGTRGYADVVLRTGSMMSRTPTDMRSQATMRRHRLILLTFRGPCPPNHESSHENGKRLDNRLANLKWETRKANHARKRAHGTAQIGERHGLSRMTVPQVVAMRAEYATGGFRMADLGKKYGISTSTVCQIVNRRTWKHV